MDETRLGLVRPLLSESEKSTSGEVMIGVGPDPFEYDPAPSSSRTSSTSTDSPVPNWMLGEVLLEAGSVTVMTAVRKEARQSFNSCCSGSSAQFSRNSFRQILQVLDESGLKLISSLRSRRLFEAAAKN